MDKYHREKSSEEVGRKCVRAVEVKREEKKRKDKLSDLIRGQDGRSRLREEEERQEEEMKQEGGG